jgi:hypothetical protein
LKWLALCALALIAVGLCAGWLLGRSGLRPYGLEPDTGPVLLAVQKIGDLHTAKFIMNDVLHQDSQQEPDGLLGRVPGVAGVVHWATHNQALVTAKGSVEAGVDLSHLSVKDVTVLKQPDGTTRLRVHLPPVTVYPPNVTIQVEDSKSGPFWNDKNIVPKAEAQARTRFLDAAQNGGIRATAQENAVKMLTQMMHALGKDNVEFTF